MQTELLNRQRWRTNLQPTVGIADHIESFYNTAWRHSVLDYQTPTEFEGSTLNTHQSGRIVITAVH